MIIKKISRLIYFKYQKYSVIMVKLIFLYIFIFLLSSPLFATEFIENRGQWDTDVRYKAENAGMTAWIMPGSVVYDYSKLEVNGRDTSLAGHVIKCSLAGASAIQEFTPSGRNKIVRNYFTGNDPEKWAKHVVSYSAVTAKDIYPGTDIRYYFDASGMRYDFILYPGAVPENIRMKFSGQDYIDIDADGNLVLGTSLGEIKHGQIFAYQESGKPGDSRLSAVLCRFVLNTDGSVGLSPGNYDPDLPLVIDPLVYSTYFGGDRDDLVNIIETRDNESFYAVGRSKSENNVVPTPGAYDEYKRRSNQAIIIKLNRDAEIEVLTAFGIGMFMNINTITFDHDKIYIAGRGHIYGPMMFEDAYDSSCDYMDSPKSFVGCLGKDLDTLYRLTLLGTDDYLQYASKIKIIDDEVYFAGKTEKYFFPFTNLYFKSDPGVNSQVSFLAVFDTNLTTLKRCLGIGGRGHANIIDFYKNNDNSISLFGLTSVFDLPCTENARDSIFRAKGEESYNTTDFFVAEVNNSFDSLNYLSYLGGNQTDTLFQVLRESDSLFILYGYTRSGDFPGIPDGEDVGFKNADILIAEVGRDYELKDVHILGDKDGNDRGSTISWSNAGGFILAGLTWSLNFPVTEDAFQPEKTEPYVYENPDIFLMDISRNCDTIRYATYLGGSSWEIWPHGTKIDNDYFISGHTTSADYPVTDDARQKEYADRYDIYFTKFHFDHPSPVIEEMPQSQNISTYPNPFRDRFTFVLENNSETEIQAVLYNIQGIETARTTYTNLAPGTYSLPFAVPEIPSGAYVLKISSGGKIISTCRVVKE